MRYRGIRIEDKYHVKDIIENTQYSCVTDVALREAEHILMLDKLTDINKLTRDITFEDYDNAVFDCSICGQFGIEFVSLNMCRNATVYNADIYGYYPAFYGTANINVNFRKSFMVSTDSRVPQKIKLNCTGDGTADKITICIQSEKQKICFNGISQIQELNMNFENDSQAGYYMSDCIMESDRKIEISTVRFPMYINSILLDSLNIIKSGMTLVLEDKDTTPEILASRAGESYDVCIDLSVGSRNYDFSRFEFHDAVLCLDVGSSCTGDVSAYLKFSSLDDVKVDFSGLMKYKWVHGVIKMEDLYGTVRTVKLENCQITEQ